MDLSEFGPIVGRIVNSPQFESIEKEDLEQYLWEKWLTVYPSVKDKEQIEQFKICKTVLTNAAIDLSRKETRRLKRESIKDDIDVLSYLSIGTNGEENIDHSYVDPITGYHIVSERQLFNLIMAWSYQQSNKIQYFIKQCLDPDYWVLEKWQEMREDNTRLWNYSVIPPASLCKILGISKNFFERKIKNPLDTILAHVEVKGDS